MQPLLALNRCSQHLLFVVLLLCCSYLTKAPLVPEGTPVINALNKQRSMLENVMRACVGLGPESNMLLEFKM